jgi:hypothetical protein
MIDIQSLKYFAAYVKKKYHNDTFNPPELCALIAPQPRHHYGAQNGNRANQPPNPLANSTIDNRFFTSLMLSKMSSHR